MRTQKLTKEKIINVLRKNKLFLKKQFDVDNIILFGSYARDEATPDSDIDILIESRKKSFHVYVKIHKFLEDKFNKKIDVIYLDLVNPFIMEFIEKELIYA
ncbi:MAG: nucleotidyltransferase family protein [bacterium]